MTTEIVVPPTRSFIRSWGGLPKHYNYYITRQSPLSLFLTVVSKSPRLYLIMTTSFLTVHLFRPRQLGSALCILSEPVTMGGNPRTDEPISTTLLELYPESYQIFLQAGWVDYFRRLPDFNTHQVLEFACNLRERFSIVQGV